MIEGGIAFAYRRAAQYLSVAVKHTIRKIGQLVES